MPIERDLISRGSGKWSQAGIPHRGWTCVGYEDLGDPSQTCEMCERMEIRYVHYMQHPLYPDKLACGQVCAGNMENDLARSEERERRLVNRAARRRNWLTRNWKTSKKGNDTLTIERRRVTIYPGKYGGWGYSPSIPRSKDAEFGPKFYDSPALAKLAAFDHLFPSSAA